MSNQRDYFEWIESEAMSEPAIATFMRERNPCDHPLGSRPMLGDKSLDPDSLITIEDCVEFANDPRHESGLMFDGRPLRNTEMSALLTVRDMKRDLVRLTSKLRDRTSADYLTNDKLVEQIILLGQQMEEK